MESFIWTCHGRVTDNDVSILVRLFGWHQKISKMSFPFTLRKVIPKLNKQKMDEFLDNATELTIAVDGG